MNTFLKILFFLLISPLTGCFKAEAESTPVPTVTVVTAEIEIIDSNIFNQ